MAQMTTTARQVATEVSHQIAECGVTVVWLCDRTGIARTTMLRRLSGHSPFNLDELDAIATALRIPTSTLIHPAEQVAS